MKKFLNLKMVSGGLLCEARSHTVTLFGCRACVCCGDQCMCGGQPVAARSGAV